MSVKLDDPIHFIGIGGSGMAPLAAICQTSGLSTQGSDSGKANPTLQQLKDLNIPLYDQHASSNLGHAKTVVVSSAIGDDNLELQAAKERGLQLLHRSDILAWFLSQKPSITVAGTHGKTTISAMIAYMLHALGVDPSAAIGGRMENFKRNYLAGKGMYHVAEVDESDGTLSKHRPFIGVLSNIDNDHLNHFGSIELINAEFKNYLNQVNPEGCCVIGWDQKICRDIGHALARPKLSYGFVIGSDVRAINLQHDGPNSRFTAIVERDQIDVFLPAIGKHNICNALAALAVARALELDVKQAAESLASFQGVTRRLSKIYADEDHIIFDDYAHNPGKITATLSALATSFPEYTLNCIYQPHRYSRLSTMFDEFMHAFSTAQHVFVVPVYAAGEAEPGQDFSVRRLAGAIGESSQTRVTAVSDSSQVVNTVIKNIAKPAIIVTLGAGDIWQVGDQIRNALAATRKKT